MAPRRAQGAEWVPETCSKSDLAVILGVSTRAVSDWDTRGVLVRAAGGRYQTLASINNYIASLREKKAGRKSALGAEGPSEKDLNTKVIRQINELKLAQLQGDVLTLEEVTESWGRFATAVKGAVLTIPTRARKTIGHLTPHDGETLKRVCRDVLIDLARRVSDQVIAGDTGSLENDE